MAQSRRGVAGDDFSIYCISSGRNYTDIPPHHPVNKGVAPGGDNDGKQGRQVYRREKYVREHWINAVNAINGINSGHLLRVTLYISFAKIDPRSTSSQM